MFMGIPDLQFAIDTLQAHIPEGQQITAETRLEDIGVNDVVLCRIKNDLMARMRLPFDGDPTQFHTWFTHGISHEPAREIYGKAKTVHRLSEIILQGFMNADNFNEVGGLD
jgi:hypothetical protein